MNEEEIRAEFSRLHHRIYMAEIAHKELTRKVHRMSLSIADQDALIASLKSEFSDIVTEATAEASAASDALAKALEDDDTLRQELADASGMTPEQIDALTSFKANMDTAKAALDAHQPVVSTPVTPDAPPLPTP